MSELKPCPFCEGVAKLQSAPPQDNYFVKCRRCDAFTMKYFRLPEEAVTAWNRRAKPANEPLTLNELRWMDGEPVWSDIGSYWLLVTVCGSEVWLTDTSGEQANATAWIKCTKYMGNLYRRKPEGGENDAKRI